MVSCPNPDCKREFNTPISTINLQADPTNPYNACPYCLTKIDEALEERAEPQQITKQTPPAQEEVKVTDTPAACRHHVGYLSERTQSQQIPEDCLICKDIVECMLKKMRSNE